MLVSWGNPEASSSLAAELVLECTASNRPLAAAADLTESDNLLNTFDPSKAPSRTERSKPTASPLTPPAAARAAARTAGDTGPTESSSFSSLSLICGEPPTVIGPHPVASPYSEGRSTDENDNNVTHITQVLLDQVAGPPPTPDVRSALHCPSSQHHPTTPGV